MDSNYRSEFLFNTRETRPSLVGTLLFAATLGAAIILYVTTREPLIALILPWLHGAWEPIRTAFWLLKSDPVRCRARICFAFYIAAGCWRAAAAAFLAVIAFVFVAMTTGLQPSMDEFTATMWALVGGLALNTLIGLGAICAAVVCKVRIWVHPGLRKALHDDLRLAANFGPHPRSGFNYAVFVVATTIMLPLTVAGAACLVAPPADELVGLLAVFGVPIAAIPCYAWLSSRIIARSAQECWPADTIV